MTCQTSNDTLRILHLPPHLSNERRDELLKKYGAVETKTVRKSSKYTTTYAKFPTKHAATEAFLRLHQLEVRGQRLSVEFSKKSIGNIADTETRQDDTDNVREESNKAHFQAFLKKLNNWFIGNDFTQPPPPHITYRYSLPTKGTLMRIAIQLIKEPIFYTQVLHLMNRMNLPPPFEELENEFPNLKEHYNIEKYKDLFNWNDRGKEGTDEEGEEEEEESEWESDEDNIKKPVEAAPIKRKRQQNTKRFKIPKFVNPAKQLSASSSNQKVIRPEDVFEPVQQEELKTPRIDVKTVNKLPEFDDKPENVSKNVEELEGGFGLMFPTRKAEDSREQENAETSKEAVKETTEQEFITSDQLTSNRISVNDQRLLPVFKNYHPGKPSSRLYIKNLAKQVDLKDLQFIYGKYTVPELKDAEHQFDIRLMQEGRMKGQAFVSLQNTEQAKLALEETNGYILKDKPMVVQFAKAAKS